MTELALFLYESCGIWAFHPMSGWQMEERPVRGRHARHLDAEEPRPADPTWPADQELPAGVAEQMLAELAAATTPHAWLTVSRRMDTRAKVLVAVAGGVGLMVLLLSAGVVLGSLAH